MTRKKRAAPEPPIFTGAEKFEIETSRFEIETSSSSSFRASSACYNSNNNKPKPSMKSRPAPPPPLPRKMLPPRTVTTTATIIISPDNRPNNSNINNTNNNIIVSSKKHHVDIRPHNHHNSNNGHNKPNRQIIRRDYFSDDDDFDDFSFDDNSTSPPPTSKTPNVVRPSSGRESPNESICTTDSGVNSDLVKVWKYFIGHYSQLNALRWIVRFLKFLLCTCELEFINNLAVENCIFPSYQWVFRIIFCQVTHSASGIWTSDLSNSLIDSARTIVELLSSLPCSDLKETTVSIKNGFKMFYNID